MQDLQGELKHGRLIIETVDADQRMNIFLASPLFNDRQRAKRDAICTLLEQHGTVWHAQRDGEFCPPDADQKTRQRVFQMNTSAVEQAHLMVAVLDYELERETEDLAVIEQQGPYKKVRRYVRLPDSGVVFELGVAYSEGVPAIGFISHRDDLNLMLAETCATIVFDEESLENVVKYILAYYEGGCHDSHEVRKSIRCAYGPWCESII